MIEPTMYEVRLQFKDGAVLIIKMTDIDVDTMFDKLWERDSIKWMNVWEDIINLEEVRYIQYKELESEEE